MRSFNDKQSRNYFCLACAAQISWGVIGHTARHEVHDYRLYYVNYAKANHSRGSSQYLPEHRAKVSRRPRFVSEGLRALPRRVTVGGVYPWNSRPEAEAMYTESWRSFVREKYRTDPTVTHFEGPVVVDNVAQQVLTDE